MPQSWHPHPLSYLGYYILSILVFGLGFYYNFWYPLLGVAMFILSELLRRAENLTVGEKGIEKNFRFVSTSQVFIEYLKVQDLKVSQGLIERIFGLGTIYINSAGSPEAEILFRGIMDPYGVEKLIRGRMTE
ncbi:MAG: PH domain-containing protein [Candidatus Liptonbacteria bacterium]